MPRVVLHLGLPKTGTSFLQSVLKENQAVLRDLGIHRPDAPGQNLFLAVLALTERSDSWGRSAEAGQRAWRRVLADLARHDGTTVISQETLCLAEPDQVKRVLADLGDAGVDEVDVVVTVRDPARQVPGEWQEGVKHGRRDSYARFLDAVLGEPDDTWQEADLRRHRRFWSGQDPVAVLDRWGADLPRDRVHVVVNPPPGAPPEELWRRFAEVLGVPADSVTMPASGVNVSLGAVQLEVLRRVNQRFTRRGREASYGRVAKRIYAGKVLRGQRGAKVVLPVERLEVADRLATGWGEGITQRGWHVVGPVDDLRPAPATDRVPGSDPGEVSTDDMLTAALDATASLLEELERVTRDNMRLRQAASSTPVRRAARRARGWWQERRPG